VEKAKPSPFYVGKQNKIKYMLFEILAEITGNIHYALQSSFGCLSAAFGVGLIGARAVEAVGRNPGASGKILVQSILGMALVEAIAFYSLFLGR
jgi:F-type H+-transporting ATPase subunit c